MSNNPYERPMVIELIRSSVQEMDQRRIKAGNAPVPGDKAAAGMFTIHPANHWLHIEKQKPNPKMLFGSFWHQHELCIMFADTNMGKSILAVQLGNSISRQDPIGPFELHAEPANVLYIDFELSAKQFELRYTHHRGSYEFAANFYRAEFNALDEVPYQFKSFEEYLRQALDYAVTSTAARVLIIDNITCLRSGTERADEALALMKHLKALKVKHHLSILVLAHTPKRNPLNPITRNDLHGSKMLINFADSAFAIGESHAHRAEGEAPVRYLKQIKQRSGIQQYGTDKVCLCRLAHNTEGLLHFEFTGYAHEYDHLLRHTQQQRDRNTTQVAQLLAEGLSQRQIAARLKLSVGMVNKLVNWGK